jgi:Predicted metal-binding integral membrane protein (DUF2182)
MYLTRCRDLDAQLSAGSGPFVTGVRNGGWCVGCSWALMAALFALGAMSLTWMAVIGALVAFEKAGPRPRLMTLAAAALLVLLAIAVLAVPHDVPGFVVPGSSSTAHAMSAIASCGVVEAPGVGDTASHRSISGLNSSSFDGIRRRRMPAAPWALDIASPSANRAPTSQPIGAAVSERHAPSRSRLSRASALLIRKPARYRIAVSPQGRSAYGGWPGLAHHEDDLPVTRVQLFSGGLPFSLRSGARIVPPPSLTTSR